VRKGQGTEGGGNERAVLVAGLGCERGPAGGDRISRMPRKVEDQVHLVHMAKDVAADTADCILRYRGEDGGAKLAEGNSSDASGAIAHHGGHRDRSHRRRGERSHS